ncbi:hypothetical protein DFH11DRAFT_1547945 [Phellopilus nigrolimitatus]|nr:hypothetical protein DFH11DRAFT_1547945 [Phellopilus nigrolimitatus]
MPEASLLILSSLTLRHSAVPAAASMARFPCVAGPVGVSLGGRLGMSQCGKLNHKLQIKRVHIGETGSNDRDDSTVLCVRTAKPEATHVPLASIVIWRVCSSFLLAKETRSVSIVRPAMQSANETMDGPARRPYAYLLLGAVRVWPSALSVYLF